MPEFKKIFRVKPYISDRPGCTLRWVIKSGTDESWYHTDNRENARQVCRVLQSAYFAGFSTARQNAEVLHYELLDKIHAEFFKRMSRMNGDLE